MPHLPTPLPVSRAINELARQLALARRRRRFTQESLAERMGVGVNTIRRLEAGAPGIALETLARALFVLGELPRLERLLAPETDALGLALAEEALPQRVRARKAPAAAYRSAIPRALLENLQNRRAVDPQARSILGQEGVEGWLEKFLSRHDETALNRLRDQARAISEELKWGEEFEKLDRLIGALLGTRKTSLKHPRAIARAQGLPFDAERIDLFQTVSTYLNDNPPVVAPAQANADPALQAFVESYFSNFIEGTEFELEEAYQIVMSATPLKYREDDSHDVIGTFNAIMTSGNKPLADTREAFERQLLDWNAQVIFSRSSKNPGHWKERGNQAGNTVFVSPPLVLGTLAKGFELIAATPQPEARAALAKFVVSEIHPFTDGNGRVSRLLMNQILSAAGLTRIIIPTVFREDYTLSLKALSNNANAEPYARMLTRAAKFSSLLDYSSQARLFKQLEASNALKDHSTDKLRLKNLERVE